MLYNPPEESRWFQLLLCEKETRNQNWTTNLGCAKQNGKSIKFESWKQFENKRCSTMPKDWLWQKQDKW